jgi:hypothetical protein
VWGVPTTHHGSMSHADGLLQLVMVTACWTSSSCSRHDLRRLSQSPFQCTMHLQVGVELCGAAVVAWCGCLPWPNRLRACILQPGSSVPHWHCIVEVSVEALTFTTSDDQ